MAILLTFIVLRCDLPLKQMAVFITTKKDMIEVAKCTQHGIGQMCVGFATLMFLTIQMNWHKKYAKSYNTRLRLGIRKPSGFTVDFQKIQGAVLNWQVAYISELKNGWKRIWVSRQGLVFSRNLIASIGKIVLNKKGQNDLNLLSLDL